jgi:DNA-binding beta-propeller fold protein YncE
LPLGGHRPWRVGAVALPTFTLVVLFAIHACLDGGTGPPKPPRDTVPPSFQVTFPNDSAYDLDGDRLVDFLITWSDSNGAVDPASVVVRSLHGVNGPADTATNLLTAWRVVRNDSTGLVFSETLENLLHGGPNLIELRVADTAGNFAVDTVGFDLPNGAFIKTIVTGLSSATAHGVGMAVCPDDHRAYMTAGRRIVVADADSLVILGDVLDPYAGADLQVPLCVPGDPVLYVTEFVERFDRPTMTWMPRVTGAFASVGIVQSRAFPETLYVGESYDGIVGVVERSLNARTGYFLPLDTTLSEYVFDLEVTDDDQKLYATRYAEGGILVADPRSGAILSRISVGGPKWPDRGRADGIALSPDGRHLYAAVLDGDPRGVVDIDTDLDTVVRTLDLSAYVPQDLAVSPSGKRVFVTTQDRFADPSQNVLADVRNWLVLAEFPRPRPAGQIRFDGGAAFHPNGKLVFVGHNLDVDVYLSRE